jgi:polyamine oxidase
MSNTCIPSRGIFYHCRRLTLLSLLSQGAAWMHETSQNRLVKLIPKLGVEYYYDDGAPLYYTPHGKAGAQFKAKKVADEFADYCEWYYDNHADAPDKSVDEFVREFVNNHELITEDERLWAPQATREVCYSTPQYEMCTDDG